MATYVIGDIHGCLDQLQDLLNKIHYNQQQDTLWFTGDLVNGGPKSLETLRFIKDLPTSTICVLGNHDLTLLGVAAGKIIHPQDRKFGLESILTASDRDALLEWLRWRPLAHYDATFNALLVHAGVIPQWDIVEIQQHSHEMEAVLRSDLADHFFANMFGNTPDEWDPKLSGSDRYRFIHNCFTRIRFCDPQGKIELDSKGDINSAPPGFYPWYTIANRKTADINIIFGHWAALLGNANVANIYAIDTGCVWGHELTALRLDDWQKFSVPGLEI